MNVKYFFRSVAGLRPTTSHHQGLTAMMTTTKTRARTRAKRGTRRIPLLEEALVPLLVPLVGVPVQVTRPKTKGEVLGHVKVKTCVIKLNLYILSVPKTNPEEAEVLKGRKRNQERGRTRHLGQPLPAQADRQVHAQGQPWRTCLGRTPRENSLMTSLSFRG